MGKGALLTIWIVASLAWIAVAAYLCLGSWPHLPMDISPYRSLDQGRPRSCDSRPRDALRAARRLAAVGGISLRTLGTLAALTTAFGHAFRPSQIAPCNPAQSR